MSKFLNKLPNIALWTLFAASIVIALLFYMGGGEEVEINGNPWNQPYFTDALLDWSYILFGLACLITIVAVVAMFVKLFKANLSKALVSLGGVAAFIGLFIIS